MSCEPNTHEFKVEPIQTVSRAIDQGEVHSVTMFLKYCVKCGTSDEICKHESQEFVNQDVN